jgi:ClpP class serine protease
MQQTYNQFTERVMTTRTGKIKDIDKIARGRIFLANQALDLGMVDQLGGVNDAIALAAKIAGMAEGSYDVRVVPGPKSLADLFNDPAESRMPVPSGNLASTSDLLLNAFPIRDRALLDQQFAVMRLFESHPIALVCPYRVVSR